MSEHNDGGPAFPAHPDMISVDSNGTVAPWGYQGMSLRDYFAAKAMQAIVTKLPIVDQNSIYGDPVEDKVQHNLDIAQSAYWIADAMLSERDK